MSREYKTQDLALAAFLFAVSEPGTFLRLEGDGSKWDKNFVFTETEQVLTLEFNYKRRLASVEPQAYYNAVRDLKRLVIESNKKQ